MSPLGFEPRTPASLRTYLKETNSYELGSYKSSALARLSYGLTRLKIFPIFKIYQKNSADIVNLYLETRLLAFFLNFHLKNIYLLQILFL